MTSGSELGPLTDQILRDPGKPFRVGVCTSIQKTSRPPLIAIDGRLMRYLDSARDVVPGDTVVWGVNGATPFAVGRLSGSAAPMEAVTPVLGGVGFTAGWSNFGGGFNPASYWRDPDGWVHLEGLVGGGASATGIFTLPVGYRPPASRYYITTSTENTCQITVLTNGVVEWRTVAGSLSTYVTLSGIRFFAGTTAEQSSRFSNIFQFEGNPGVNEGMDQFSMLSPLAQRRDDGLWRLQGQWFSTQASNTKLANMPMETGRKFTSMWPFLTYNGTTTVAAGRLDIDYDATVAEHNHYNNVGAWSDLGGIGVWGWEAEPGWIDLSTVNGWTGYGGNHGYLRYRKDRYGIVHLVGLIANGTTTGSTVLTTLPAGYRPGPNSIMFGVINNGVIRRLDINAAGQVVIGSGWANAYSSLSSVFFKAA